METVQFRPAHETLSTINIFVNFLLPVSAAVMISPCTNTHFLALGSYLRLTL